ncbi:MAG: citrate synthase [Planctomycetes bacterium]|nr:citrate synthase [Planctomycetota bacterium]
MSEKAILKIDGKEIELPILQGTEGERAIDITQLRAKTGFVTYDPSFGNTACCSSKITFVDGEKGILRYRGIPIEQFTGHPNFAEVAWLLIFGSLPTRGELQGFSDLLTENELLHEGMKNQFDHVTSEAPPMAILSSVLSNLSCFHPQLLAVDDVESMAVASARLISKVRTIAAFSYRRSRGLPFIYPDPKLRYCANFLHMMFSIPYQQYQVTPEIEDALNLVFILHADHEQNCSTSTVRTVGSSRANLYASCAAAVSALWGPLHGGANTEVLNMLEKIHAGGMSAEEVVREAKKKDSEFRLFGFGHRVYKTYDPRAKILAQSCDRVLATLHRQDPLLDVARKLEERALNDSYFVERRLYPNVDFYSGILLRAIGIPKNMFPVFFSMGRLPGWIAQWKEQHEDPHGRITRPRQIYMGPNLTNYVPIDQRG